ncbi:GNAT family N-acetyltransferase [Derxia lacustris]|uniref:GNAT family N-acetyltransferase n=1 Tax=Derxia lacustris TaxID=764842 RepID=UPI000A17196E|nr:GNAT family N-acetyltransferase [Derxia lacustris]
MTETEAGDGTRLVSDLAAIGAERWNALVRVATGRLHPALRHEYLDAFHASGCATRASGWEPGYLTLWRAGELIAAAPLYRKYHSWGEYVFDWAWAEAYERNGLRYYPKLLVAVPFTPVGAPKLLAVDAEARAALATALLKHAVASGLSSLHVLFTDADESALLESAGLMLRRNVQFHWHNPGWSGFDDYLASLAQPKRKKIRAERRQVAAAGVTFQKLTGADITPEHWAFFHRCYSNTYLEHHSRPYLNLDFFQRLGASMGEQVLLVIGSRDGRPVAAALNLFDADSLYGRYWGALEHIACLHFEACYYQAIEFCIDRGIRHFEGGAQGEHKLARGFLPAEMRSAHWIGAPKFADAVEHYLQRESQGIERYIDELEAHTPFRQNPAIDRPAADASP